MHELIKSTDADIETKILTKETCSSAILSTTNPRQTGSGMNPCLSCQRPAMAEPDTKNEFHTGTTITYVHLFQTLCKTSKSSDIKQRQYTISYFSCKFISHI
jgi:hypothetical protein